ncbi:MAG: hypothetical protein Q4E09_03705, partial [Eubacteriales bacterium]|nr:hypothetical protein [Eubacteriales bacterium]
YSILKVRFASLTLERLTILANAFLLVKEICKNLYFFLTTRPGVSYPLLDVKPQNLASAAFSGLLLKRDLAA